MKSFTVLASPRAEYQQTHAAALEEGLRLLGINVSHASHIDGVKDKHVAVWGWRGGRRLRENGHEVLVMERGYIGDRFRYTSLGWNGLNGYASFPEYPDDGGSRFRAHGGVIKPWKSGGSHALILGQVPTDASLRGMNVLPWYERQAARISEETGISVHFRQHPELSRRGIRQIVKGTLRSPALTLDEALATAAFSLCYNSNSSVDSILAGVPCVVCDAGSMSNAVASAGPSDLKRPIRERWAHSLAWKQWEIDEIRNGLPLRSLMEMANG